MLSSILRVTKNNSKRITSFVKNKPSLKMQANLAEHTAMSVSIIKLKIVRERAMR